MNTIEYEVVGGRIGQYLSYTSSDSLYEGQYIVVKMKGRPDETVAIIRVETYPKPRLTVGILDRE